MYLFLFIFVSWIYSTSSVVTKTKWPTYIPTWARHNGENYFDGNCYKKRYGCPQDQEDKHNLDPNNKHNPFICWDLWPSPFCPYDPVRVEIKNIGWVIGRTFTHKTPTEEVRFDKRFVNIFLGIPYAKPPVEKRRFKKPETLGQGFDLDIREWDASYYRPACPQEIWKMPINYHEFFEQRNTSEDCLYLNIFQPNNSYVKQEYKKNGIPVVLFIHGEDYVLGDSKTNPGHQVADKNVIFITFDYRLGAFGFLSTDDEHSPGNYGIYDVLKVLEWIRINIKSFMGNPHDVTLIGSGSGASIASILQISPKSYDVDHKQLFHKVIMMSGSSLCEWSIVKSSWDVTIVEYAKHLGKQVGCDPYLGLSMEKMVDCLRKKSEDEIASASSRIKKAYGSLSGPFGPVVDGPDGILPQDPQLMYSNQYYSSSIKPMKLDVIAGINRDAGSHIVYEATKNITGLNISKGIDYINYLKVVEDIFSHLRGPPDAYYHGEVVQMITNSISFEYTEWSNLENITALRQNLIDMWTDRLYGSCVDALLKASDKFQEMDRGQLESRKKHFFYVFNHRSELETLPKWMGVVHGRDREYFLGFPYFNSTHIAVSGIEPLQEEYNELDQNISQLVQDMFVNFTRYNIPILNPVLNYSWYPNSTFDRHGNRSLNWTKDGWIPKTLYTDEFGEDRIGFLDQKVLDEALKKWLEHNQPPTLEWQDKVPWYEFRYDNLTYLEINNHSYLGFNHRQKFYYFWYNYFPIISSYNPLRTTPQPTPQQRVELQAITFGFTGFSIIVMLIITALGITLRRKFLSSDNYLT